MDTVSIVNAIRNGTMDPGLDLIGQAVEDRRRIVGRQILQELSEGDRVRIAETVRPKKYAGRVATVAVVRGTTATVRFDGELLPIRVPASLLRRVD